MTKHAPYFLISENSSSLKSGDIFLSRYIEKKDNSKLYVNLQENLLVIILKGEKRFKTKHYSDTVSSKEFVFFKKGIYLMNQITDYCDKEYESLLLFIGDNFLNNIIKKYKHLSNTKSNQIFYKGFSPDFVFKETKLILELLKNKKSEYKEILYYKTSEILHHLIINDKNRSFISFLISTIDSKQDFENFINENYYKYSNIDEFAKAYNISPSTFKRNFKKIFNNTPYRWLNLKKLEMAKNLLSHPDFNITEACYLSGFNSLSVFIKNYKKVYGLTPGEYKKMTLIN